MGPKPFWEVGALGTTTGSPGTTFLMPWGLPFPRAVVTWGPQVGDMGAVITGAGVCLQEAMHAVPAPRGLPVPGLSAPWQLQEAG